MVDECQDGFRKSQRGHSCLDAPLKDLKDISKHVELAEACEVPAALVTG